MPRTGRLGLPRRDSHVHDVSAETSAAECVWLPWWCGSACLLEALGVGVQTLGSVFGDQ